MSEINPGVQFVKNVLFEDQNGDKTIEKSIVQDTIVRSEVEKDGLTSFYYRNGKLHDLALNKVLIYEGHSPKSSGAVLTASTGFVSCDGYFVNSSDGFIYNYNGDKVVGSMAWSPQLTENEILYYVKLEDNGIYYVNPSHTEPAEQQVGSLVLKTPVIRYAPDINGEAVIAIFDTGELSGSGKKEIVAVDPVTGAYKSVLADDTGYVQDFHIHGNDIYYLDANFELFKNNDSTPFITDEKICQFFFNDNKLYYVRHSLAATPDNMDMKLIEVNM